MSVLERCPAYRESNKGSKERQGPTLCVRFTEVSVKREPTVYRKAPPQGPTPYPFTSILLWFNFILGLNFIFFCFWVW